MLNASIANIGLGKVCYGTSFDLDAIWLISGSLDFVVAHGWSIKNATLLLLLQHYPVYQAAPGSSVVETLPHNFWGQHPLHGIGAHKHCVL
jgi:hypothetical protein